MTFITGEQLEFLSAPEIPRSQLRQLMDYLTCPIGCKTRVCTLYGFRRTGKTTLILQAIRGLIDAGVDCDKIGYFTGMKGDNFDDVYIELENHREIEYVFIDEIGFFANFLSVGNYLYDTQVRLYNHKVVISGTNLLALYVAKQHTLFDRCEIIRVPYLSFFEHCKFVLHTESPTYEQFMDYVKYGGLFEKIVDTSEYVQSSITRPIMELFDTQPEGEVFVWLKPSSDTVQWEGIVNTILFLSSNTVTNKSFRDPVSLVQDFQALDHTVSHKVARDFKQYFSLSALSRSYSMKKTETVALLNFLTHCGAILVLQNLYTDAEQYKCYVQAPFLRFSFTDKLNNSSGGGSFNEHTPLFGDLVEATVISEYARSHQAASIRFARTHVPSTGDSLGEIDLLDLDSSEAFEVKLTSGRGYLSEQVELEGFSFTILEGECCMRQVYNWGRLEYCEGGD